MNGQKTIHEKWEDGEISIIPKKKLSEKEIKEKLKDTTLTSEEKNELLEMLWEGIPVEKN